MKKLFGVDIDGSYVFNPAAQTITLLGYTYDLNNFLLITNVTRNTIIYNFADSTTGASSFANNVLTLDYDTSTHSASDILQIFVDVPETALANVDGTEQQLVFLRRIAKLIDSIAANDGSGRQRVIVDTATAVTTVTTVTTCSTVTSVTNVAALAGYDQRLYVDWARQAYNSGIRQQLSFT